jgi:hypothetical protein
MGESPLIKNFKLGKFLKGPNNFALAIGKGDRTAVSSKDRREHIGDPLIRTFHFQKTAPQRDVSRSNRQAGRNYELQLLSLSKMQGSNPAFAGERLRRGMGQFQLIHSELSTARLFIACRDFC